ncbi:MAG: DUF359 domain-containing protein [Minisyncoccales bacterium]
MKTYFLPKELKSKLRKVWGIPIFGKRKRVKERFLKFIEKKGGKKIIAVGDYCSFSLPADVKIFDGKIRRKKINLPPKFGCGALKCKNPPGTIQAEVWPKIKKAIKENKNLFVEGEEDLLVIPAVLVSPKNSLVIYGFPKKGICAIEVNQKIKKKIKNLLKLFLECEQ